MPVEKNALNKHLPFYKRFGFKLSASYILALTLVLFSAGLITLQISQNIFERLVRSQFKHALTVNENFIEQYTRSLETWVKHLADEPKLQLALNSPNNIDINAFLTEHKAVFFLDTTVILLNKQGKVIYKSHDCNCLGDSFLGIDVVKQVYTDHTIASAIVHEENHFSFYSVSPVSFNSNLVGFVIVAKRINHDFANTLKKNTNIDTSIVRDRAIMATTLTYEQHPLIDLPLPYLEYLGLLENPGRDIHIQFTNQDYFVVAKKLQHMDIGLSGSIMLVKSRQELAAMEQILVTQFGLLTLIALSIIMLMSLRISKTFISPIQQLTETSLRIAEGESGVKVNISQQDEIGILANNFNTMLSKIEQKNAAIQKQNETLDQKVTEKTQSLISTMDELKKLTIAVEQSPASVIITDLDAKIEYVNPSFEKITGYTSDEVVGKKPNILKSGHTTDEEYQTLWETLLSGKPWRGEFYNRTKQGELYWERALITPIKGENNQTTHYLGIKEDITAYKAYEQKLIEQATYDPLTSLPNRVLAKDRLSLALSTASREKSLGALIFIDLDNFKMVNDTLGHQAGDNLLIEVAKRLQNSVREGDTVARLSGDEFLIILSGLKSHFDAETVAEKVLEELGKPIRLQSQELIVTASLGITIFPSDDSNPDNLMRNADTAMYQAKNSGKNVFCFFSDKLNAQAQQRLKMEQCLRKALQKDELSLHYQPIINSANQQIVAAEALARWHSPEQGFVPPETFISLAEEIGLIEPIGNWILWTACRQAMLWAEQGRPLKIAINISPKQLSKSDVFLKTVKHVLHETKLPTRYLELELTESSLIQNPEESVVLLNNLKDLGIRLSIDDFGTGYSSLSYLKYFPFDTLKIDRSFMEGVPEDESDSLLTANIIRMAHDLGMEVVGEGVETKQQQAFLTQNTCDLLQGYYFSHPLPDKEFSLLLSQKSNK